MIQTKEDLKEFLREERLLYFPPPKKSLREMLRRKLTSDETYLLWRFQKLLRYAEYHKNNQHRIRTHLYVALKNALGTKLGIWIPLNVFDKGLRIWHTGIVINVHSKIGKNCQLHGGNCIGNKGKAETGKEVPIIGDNLDLGFGSGIFGKVTLGDNIIVGANAVVLKDYEDNLTLVGTPAVPIISKEEKNNGE